MIREEEKKTAYLLTVRHTYEAVEIREYLKNFGIFCELRQSGAEGYLEILGWKSPVDIMVPADCLFRAKELTERFNPEYESGISDEELEAQALAAGMTEDM